MEKKIFDIAIIGAGIGGYVAAIKAALLGKNVALIEKDLLGGTCLNTGCIPTKALLSHAKKYAEAKESQKFGIHIENISFDFEKMIENKDQTVSFLRKSLFSLLKSHGVSIIEGVASFEDTTHLLISPTSSSNEKNSPLGALSNEEKQEGKSEKYLIQAEKIIIATGSDISHLPFCPCDEKLVFDSTSILKRKKLPKTIAIIGGGYIGCEYATFFAELGAKVTIIEALDSIICSQDNGVIFQVEKALKKLGVTLLTKSKIEKVDKITSTEEISDTREGVSISLETGESIEAEIALIAVGRRCYTDTLNLEKIGINLGEKGNIPIDENMQTTLPHIYAIGDVTGKYMLAHTASHQGMIAAEHAATGKTSHTMNYDTIPAVIFTKPEVASIGYRQSSHTQRQEKEKEDKNRDEKELLVGLYPVSALGKSIASKEMEGFFKIIAEKKSKKIIGAHIVSETASSLIGELAIAIEKELTLDDIMKTIHPHPTFTEGVFEAAAIALGEPIHFPPLKKR